MARWEGGFAQFQKLLGDRLLVQSFDPQQFIESGQGGRKLGEEKRSPSITGKKGIGPATIAAVGEAELLLDAQGVGGRLPARAPRRSGAARRKSP